MKLLCPSLTMLLQEVQDRRIGALRLAAVDYTDSPRATGGIPHFTTRIIVTAGLEDRLWAEWRLWVGRALAEVGVRGLLVPEAQRRRRDALLADVLELIHGAGLDTRDGVLSHDTATLDCFQVR
jgi:hypothetical protein